MDVVATNAASIADVSLKYKDLIHLKNSHTQRQISLNKQQKKVGPLQLNVIKNVLAQHFSKMVQLASSLLKYNKREEAVELLTNLLYLYQSLQIQYPNWKVDDEINNDINLIQKYLKLLKSLSVQDNQQISYIVNSLQYISWRKTISNPI